MGLAFNVFRQTIRIGLYKRRVLYKTFFFSDINMGKNSSARYYQINKERLQKRRIGGIKIFQKKKKKKVLKSLPTI